MKETVSLPKDLHKNSSLYPPTHVKVNGYHGVFSVGVTVGYILHSSGVVNSV
jgi:hypothetical protein